jgi:hypothetical protein
MTCVFSETSSLNIGRTNIIEHLRDTTLQDVAKAKIIYQVGERTVPRMRSAERQH